ncbi:hypothetical protein RND71_001085 [Anisodus tanguticus]|uniref:RING-type E3 ubiquitin transferase n=1 Tax=Anisodus tanguticus TaxID=243964 RepID=A0AAE1VQL3_9SOLA|nr:hypothetical protein RND71_001085 [Anisodus tanguticus]
MSLPRSYGRHGSIGVVRRKISNPMGCSAYCDVCYAATVECFIERTVQCSLIHKIELDLIIHRLTAPQPAATTGLDVSTVESHTKVVLGESRRVPGPTHETCPICLAEYHPKEIVKCIPECEHCFHAECIDEWLKINGSCPVCRNNPSLETLWYWRPRFRVRVLSIGESGMCSPKKSLHTRRAKRCILIRRARPEVGFSRVWGRNAVGPVTLKSLPYHSLVRLGSSIGYQGGYLENGQGSNPISGSVGVIS